MALRTIVQDGDPILKKVCRPVTKFDDRLGTLLDDMKETLLAANGLGLAGPQVGMMRRLFICLDDRDLPEEVPANYEYKFIEFINPEILELSDEQVELYEGCLSFPGHNGAIKRSKHVKVKAQDRHGEWFELEADDMLARCIQHENNHLDGITIMDLAEHFYEDDYPRGKRGLKFMRILFMGTPDIAAESLAALLDAGHEVCAVFTRRDKPVGRKQILTAPPVKQLAVEHGIPVYQPRTLRDGSSDALIQELAPDVIIVVAYGCIIPPQLLHVAKYGCINLHVSLLPKYRGSAPIQWSVLNGDAGTGVTIMQLDEGVDTGDILMVESVDIDPEETSGSLFDRVSAVGAKTLVTALEKIEAGALTPQKQDDTQATKAPPLTKDMAQFDFTQDAAHIHNWVRGMNPWPVAWFTQDGKRIKVLESRLAENPQHAAPGTVLALKPLTIAAENGAVALLTVTPEGGKPMAGTAWAAGRRLKAGDSL